MPNRFVVSLLTLDTKVVNLCIFFTIMPSPPVTDLQTRLSVTMDLHKRMADYVCMSLLITCMKTHITNL
jgi:hypothetical protein